MSDRTELAAVVDAVRAIDPLLVTAADEVDVELIRWSLSLSPRERLRAASRAQARSQGSAVHSKQADIDALIQALVAAHVELPGKTQTLTS